jgi:hypothetical protein
MSPGKTKKKSAKSAKKATKATKKKGAWEKALANCDPDDVCSWVKRMAPTGNLNPHPPGEPMPPMPGNWPWLQKLWRSYAELYIAVVHLEKRVFCNDFSIKDPFIIDCPGGGGGGNKGGPPPPPAFP